MPEEPEMSGKSRGREADRQRKHLADADAVEHCRRHAQEVRAPRLAAALRVVNLRGLRFRNLDRSDWSKRCPAALPLDVTSMHRRVLLSGVRYTVSDRMIWENAEGYICRLVLDSINLAFLQMQPAVVSTSGIVTGIINYVGWC